jgi:hypothetical protein
VSCELGFLLHDQGGGSDHHGVLLSLIYRLVRCLFGLLTALVRSDLSKDIELLVLRHENQVLRRRLRGRPRWDQVDRLWLTALSRLVNRRRWSEIPGHPATILRWHRDLVSRKWSFTRVAKRCRWTNSTFRVELNASAAALSSAHPTRPIDWVTPRARQAAVVRAVVYSLRPVVGVEDRSVQAPAPSTGGGLQCLGHELGAHVVGDRPARQTTRTQVKHRCQVDPPLACGFVA